MADAVTAPQELLLVTVNVKIMEFPSSPATAKYIGVNVVAFEIEPEPLCVHNIVPSDDEAPLTVAEPFEQMVWLPPAVAVGRASTSIEYVAVAIAIPQSLLLLTFNVKITVFPSSPTTAEYVGVNVVSLVNEPNPLCVHNIVPAEDEAPLTVAEPLEQMVWFPPALAVAVGIIPTLTA